MLRKYSVLLFVLGVGVLFVPPMGMGVHADGLHTHVLDGDDLEVSWRKLVARTWPGRLEAPRVSLHRSRPRVVQAIHELIAVLQFVDPYNYADDSPAWMATEESRERSLEQAHAILVELGRGAAKYVWQALELEKRFEKSQDMPDKFVKPYRDAQNLLKAAMEAIEAERRKDEEYLAAQDEYRALRPVVNILKYLEKEERELRRSKISAKGDAKKFKLIMQRSKENEAKRKKMGRYADQKETLDTLKAKVKKLEETLDLSEELIILQAAAKEAKTNLDKLARTSMNLGQGLDPSKIGADPAMISSELYVNHLQSVLVDMGPEALPQVRTGLRKRSMVELVTGIEKQWTQAKWVVPFALAGGSGKTKVALAADRFLKKKLKVNAVKALIEALPKAKSADRPAFFLALKKYAEVNVPNRTKAWLDWWKLNGQGATPEKGNDVGGQGAQGVIEEED